MISAALLVGGALAGNARLLTDSGIASAPEAEGLRGRGACRRDGRYGVHRRRGYGALAVERAVERLRSLGVSTVGMLSGDRRENASRIAEDLGLDLWESDLLPSDKLEHFQRISERTGGTTLFVGDGMNDAPLLAAADVGMAMGGLGADAAIEAADGVILNDDPLGAADVIEIARKTRSIVWQNIAFALGVRGCTHAGSVPNGDHVGGRICRRGCRASCNAQRSAGSALWRAHAARSRGN